MKIYRSRASIVDLGGGIGGVISTKNLHSGSASFFHYDGRGNVIELSDEAGQSQASYSYDAYGNQIKRTGDEDNAYRFSTKEYSSLTGLIYFGARYYDPEIGRFLTKDPLGFAGGINQYIYCESDPVNWIDPWGLCKGEKNWRWGEENWLWQYLHGAGVLHAYPGETWEEYYIRFKGKYATHVGIAKSLGIWGFGSGVSSEVTSRGLELAGKKAEQLAYKSFSSFSGTRSFTYMKGLPTSLRWAQTSAAFHTGSVVSGVATAGTTGYGVGLWLNAKLSYWTTSVK
ncbi:MAG: RHS repeat-associated core domain-containing protein [Bacteroidota bacterium]|nr:RHS repeat-associated core domain-containing protein [Bacteroidota bacterium]